MTAEAISCGFYWTRGLQLTYQAYRVDLLVLNWISIMILSALLTSVAINLSLCFIFVTLYTILRKQPVNINVYAPRLVSERNHHPGNQFNLERLLPTTGWVRSAWEPSNDEFISRAGLDAFVFMRIFVFSLKVFTFGGIVGILILLPINYMGTRIRDHSDFRNKSLDSFSISNINNGSSRLWIHFCAAYVFTAVVCILLYYEYEYISSKRIACFYSSKPEPHQFTVLVRGIPVPPGCTCNDAVERFFMEYHPATYVSHSVVRRSSKLQILVTDAERLYKRLTQLKYKDNNAPQRHRRDGFLGLFGHKVDLVDHYEKTLGDIEDNVRIEQSSLAGKEVPAAFVSFKTRFGAAIALNIHEGVNPTHWITEQAPEPHDVYWPFFSVTFIRRWISKLVAFVACNALTILFLIPVALVQGLTHLDQLETMFPPLRGILRLAVVSQVITGYLPIQILQVFLSFVPPIMIMLSSLQGYISWSQIQKSACTKVLWFTIWNIFFANVLSGSALYRLNYFLEPKEFPRVLAEAVPAQASFFMAYVVTFGWTNIASELFQLVPLFYNYANRLFGGEDGDDFEAPSIPYHSEIPRVLFFGLLGVTYFMLAPLILPFLLVYFCLGYIIYRNQLLYVYVPKYQTGGEFWPTVHSYTIYSLVLMHIIVLGIFGLKKLPIASGLTLPLPILTLLFNEYCQKRFFPIFKAYPAECLIKKDRDDQNNPNMSEFYEKLANAYNDPALMPIKYSGIFGSSRSPLLQTSEV